MNYGEFKRELRRLIKDELGRNVQISFEIVEKNNGRREESIVIHKQNGSQTLIGLFKNMVQEMTVVVKARHEVNAEYDLRLKQLKEGK